MRTNAVRLELVAPLSGVMVPLESVPDPLFAGKMVGDGISIDPVSGDLLAPVAGTVTQLHPSHHALTITTPEGVEVLLHIGIDTVTLRGVGFTPFVRQGEHVSAGQILLRFDVDAVACQARSLLTQVLIANSERVSRFQPASGEVVAGKSLVLMIELVETEAQEGISDGEGQIGEAVSLPNPTGLHARPAAFLAAEAKKFTSTVRLVRGLDEANAKSVVAIMGLSTRQGDLLQIKASGPDASEAIRKLSALLAEGCGEKTEAATEAPGEAPPVRAMAMSADQLAGVSASPGLAVGRIVQYRQQLIEVCETGEGSERERARLDSALHEAGHQIGALKSRIVEPAKAQILDAHLELLQDPDLFALAIQGISHGKSAGFAWQTAFVEYARRLEALDNFLLRERGNDIRDVGRRVLALIAGVKQAQIVVPDGSILIAEELTPSETASLDRSKVRGFCTTTGGATSHVAILARSLGVPAICGIDDGALILEEGRLVVLDGSHGLLHGNPSEAELALAQQNIVRLAAKREEEMSASAAPAVTRDGVVIEVVANVRNAEEAREGVRNGGEGVGLLRSEFLFDERGTAPDEEEQASAIISVAQALGRERTLVVRTLDVGGDKPLSFLPLPKEDNPFLGLRGIRVSLDHPELFRCQLRAFLRAAPFCRLHVMFPMVATLEELREARAILAEEQTATGQADVKVGIMIEVPSTAVMAEQFAREVDFFSIGTNDLTQYTLAMDRGHPNLAKKADGLHPAVLRMIDLACSGAERHGKWVGVCGGLASDALAVPVLIGLGVTELSVSVPAIPAIKALLRRLVLADCQSLARGVLELGTAAEVRARLVEFAERL